MVSLTLAATAPPALRGEPHAGLYRGLLAASTVLVVLVIGLGAYVRLSDAGLGCPDWPGCYGHLIGVPEAPHEQANAAIAFPGAAVDAGKAWKEMIHRYAAGTLGLLILALSLVAWRRTRRLLAPENGLAGLVAGQAALGMWTVTLLLKPVIVTLHLLGGMCTLALLVWLASAEFRAPAADSPASADTTTRRWLGLALLAVIGQITLGGWVSSNYAALACADFPRCQGQWWPATDFGHAFALLRPLGETTSGEALPAAALTAIHLTHRLGALVVSAVVAVGVIRLWRSPPMRPLAAGLVTALLTQIALGIGNVLLQLPLAWAVLHNLGAATLLALLVYARQRTRPVPVPAAG